MKNLFVFLFLLFSTTANGNEIGGYVDSPFIVPDGSALYFIHSVASPIDILTENPLARPVTKHLKDHVSSYGKYWWNSDIYVSYRDNNNDSGWGDPINLGININTKDLEGSPWVSDDQKTIIFSRESIDGDLQNEGLFISFKTYGSWGIPIKISPQIGDVHITKRGEIYYEWNGDIYNDTGVIESIYTIKDETQPWLNEEETELYFNRRNTNGDTSLFLSKRVNSDESWGIPEEVPLVGFADDNGMLIWGEASFDLQGRMYFVRFDTGTAGWDANLLIAFENIDGSFGPPVKIKF